MKYTVQAVIFNDDKEVLGVSRKEDHEDMGLVGGKVDPKDHEYDEDKFRSPYEAAIYRECKEETGLDINMETSEVVFQMYKDDFMSITYLIKDWSGDIETDEPHAVKWTNFDELISGSFGKYNRLVSDSLTNMGIEFK